MNSNIDFSIIDSDVICLIDFDNGDQYELDVYVELIDVEEITCAYFIDAAKAAGRYSYTSVYNEDYYEAMEQELMEEYKNLPLDHDEYYA